MISIVYEITLLFIRSKFQLINERTDERTCIHMYVC